MGVFELLYVFLHSVEPEFAVPFVDGINIGFFRDADVGVGEDEFSCGRVESKPIDLLSIGQHYNIKAELKVVPIIVADPKIA